MIHGKIKNAPVVHLNNNYFDAPFTALTAVCFSAAGTGTKKVRPNRRRRTLFFDEMFRVVVIYNTLAPSLVRRRKQNREGSEYASYYP